MKNIAKIVVPLAALAAAFALPLPYMFMGPLIGRVEKALRIEVDPRYSGGEVLAKFLDPMDDDRGEGNLVYPDLPAFQGKRVLDIVRYTVHRPVLNTAAGDSPDFWQLDIAFAETANPFKAPLGFCLPVIHIYIDIDGKKGGSTRTAQPGAELVAFDAGHPWDYMIHIDGFTGDRKGRLVSFDQVYERPVELFFVPETRTVHARVVLDDPGIKRILDGRPTYHYVVVGGYDAYSYGGFMPVLASAGPRNGGGARSNLTPRVFDWVAPEGIDQGRVLSSYDEATGSFATLVPLEAKEGSTAKTSPAAEEKKNAAELLAAYKEKLARESAEAPGPDLAAAVASLIKRGAGSTELIEAYYRSQMFDKAEEESRKILLSSPENTRAAIYLAMAIAGQSGRQSSPMKSLEFVNRAFAQFDKAFELCRTPEEKLMLYLQRGRYFSTVPEPIFRRSAAAADDYLKAASIIKQQDPQPGGMPLLTDCYINAARAFARAGEADEAEIYFRKVADREDLNTQQIVALLEQGIIPTILKR